MKRYLLGALLLLASAAYAQIDKITYPASGSIFQQNASGTYSFSFGGSMRKESGLPNLRYTLIKIDENDNVSIVSGHDNVEISSGDTKTNISGRVIFSVSGIILGKGYYHLVLYSQRNNWPFGKKNYLKDVVQFGVGDVYFVAGQSNAAGFNYPTGTLGGINIIPIDFPKSVDNSSDATIPFVSGSSSNFRARVYNYNGKYEWHAGWGYDYNDNLARQNAPIDGLPYVGGFEEFKNGTDKLTNPVRIYPNGMASWNWAPLAYKIATNTDPGLKRTPNLFFNVAYPGALIESFSSVDSEGLPMQSDGKKMFHTMQLFGNIFGAKAVLWHQGEANTLDYLLTNNTFEDYDAKLQSVINLSRKALNDNPYTPKLAWYVSQVSYSTYVYNGSATAKGFGVSSISGNSRSGINGAYTHSTLLSKQNAVINSANRIYPGINTDDIINGERDVDLYLHFSGSTTLNKVADRWYTSIKNNYPAGGVEPTSMVPISYVEKIGSNNYKITVAKNTGSAGTDAKKYYWCVNNKGIVAGYYTAVTTVNSYTFTTSNGASDILTCYIEDNNGRFYACQPFIVADPNAKIIESSKSSFSFGASGGTDNTRITTVNLDWEIQSGLPEWVSLDYNEDDLNLYITASNNISSSSRSGSIVIKEVGGSLTKILNISQLGTGVTPAISLTTLTPTNSSSEWTGYGSTRFDGKSIDGNTMQVSGVQYYQGIGTHADSRMVFNLSAGSYTTFYGKVGRDDDADNGSDLGKVQFSIKTDGSAVWNSGVHGNTTGAENFSINVTGKNTLELLVNQSGDGIYYDHANWMDVYLSGGSGTPCTHAAPTGVSASPSSHGAGGGSSTLSASCPTGTTVRWSHGLGNGSPKVTPVSITTTYTAQCVSVDCTDSSPVAVTVTVGTGCGTLTNDLVVGYWTVTGHPLVAKQFHGTWWLVQKINNSPEQFLVRGSEMLTRGDVTLTNSSYSGLVGCFAYTYSDYGGLQPPSSVTFPTPSGYNIGYEPDGTPYYTASGSPPSGCTDAYLTNSWTYASAAGSTGSIPKIGQSFDGIDMTMGSVNYSASYPGTGIGTHATSEIIYDLGASHGYTHFKSVVGKDNEAVCGEDRLVFKVYNNATNALLGTSPVVGTPSYGLPQTSEMSVDITGVRYLKLVVEDGGDYIYCDHANWARARLTCSSSGRMAATDSVASFFTVYPNVSRGEFTVDVELQTDQEVSVSLISSSGAVYQQETYQGAKGRNALKFNAAKVMSGLYHVRVSTRERVASKTVVIEK